MKQINNQKSPTSTSKYLETGRISPQACEFEEAVLGAVLIEKTAFEKASDILSADMFYCESNKLIFSACSALEVERKPIDILTVVEQLRKEGNLETAGGASYIAQLSQKVVSSAHLEYHCLVLKEKYLKRRLINVCSENMSLGFDETEDIEDTIAKINMEIEQLQEDLVGKGNTSHISESAKKSVEQFYIRVENRKKGVPPGIPTGFAELDRLTNGWQPEKLIILAARPAVGKTNLAIKFARKAAKFGTPVVFFSLEMGEIELTDRMIIAEAQLNADDYNSGEMQQDRYADMEMAMKNISRLPIFIKDNPNVTVRNIVNEARLLKKQGKCGMVIIDYLQLIHPSVKLKTREQEVSEISRLLKIHAKELKVPFIVLCQMNREIEAEKREPRLSDLRESGAIEQDADIVIFINRPGMYVEELRDKNTGDLLENYIELLIKKHRGGKLGKIKIKHNDSMTEFYDWDCWGQERQMPIQTHREIQNYYETKENSPF